MTKKIKIEEKGFFPVDGRVLSEKDYADFYKYRNEIRKMIANSIDSYLFEGYIRYKVIEGAEDE